MSLASLEWRATNVGKGVSQQQRPVRQVTQELSGGGGAASRSTKSSRARNNQPQTSANTTKPPSRARTPSRASSHVSTMQQREELARTVQRLAAQANGNHAANDIYQSAPAAASNQPAETDLLSFIAAKQAALESSKAELERSLAATRDMQAQFDSERSRLAEAEARERERERRAPVTTERAAWNPWAPDAKSGSPPADGIPSQPWRTSAADAMISTTPRSHGLNTPALAQPKRTRTASGEMIGSQSARGAKPTKDFPAGRSARHSSHPNHPQTFAPPPCADEVDVSAMLRALPNSKKTVLDLFRSSDVTCSGAVNTHEFATGLLQAGLNLSMPQVAGLIAKLDHQNRGEIRYINLIATPEETFQMANDNQLPARFFEPSPAPVAPSVYVPIPPWDTADPVVHEACRTRNRQSSGLAILRTRDRAVLQPDGTFAMTNLQMNPQHAMLTSGHTTSPDYYPRPIGFVERPYSHSLGPSNIVENPLTHPAGLTPSNSTGWGGNADGFTNPHPIPDEYGRDYHDSVMNPSTEVGAALRTISDRTEHEPARFTAMMRKLDRDGDRKVTHKEFLRGLSELGVNVPVWRLQNLIKACDRHGTGAVHYEQVGGLLSHYAEAGRREQAELEAARKAALPSSQVNPITAPGFRPSITIPLHSQPTWAPSIGLGNNVEEFTRSRQIEREWTAREQQQQQQLQQQQQPSQPPSHSVSPRHDTQAWSNSKEQPEPYREEELRTVTPPQQNAVTSEQPTAVSQRAHYPYMYRTSDEIARMEAMQQQQQQSPIEPQWQAGTELPVLEVEYPKSMGRSRTPAPRRSRSRSNSVTSVRSQTPSLRSAFGGESSSRAGSRRGSFSQASRSGGEGLGRLNDFHDADRSKFLRLTTHQPPTPRTAQRLHDSNASSYWADDRDQPSSATAAADGERGRSRSRTAESSPAHRRSASMSAPASRGGTNTAVEQFGSSQDAEFFKILRLSEAAPLSNKARNALAGSQPTQRPTQLSASPEPASFSDAPLPRTHSRSSSVTSVSASTYRDPQLTSRPSHVYSLPHNSAGGAAWSDRRARDFYGSGWTLG